MSMVALAISILIAIAAWSAWRRTALDHIRDKLFDLRDGLRGLFLDCGYGLDHPLYRRMRDLLNAYLRFTEDARFIGMVYMQVRMPPEMRREITAQIDALFATDDEYLSSEMSDIRKQAARAIQLYMLATSTLVMAAVAAVTPFVVLGSLRTGARNLIAKVKAAMAECLDESPMRWPSVEAAAQFERAAAA